MEQLALQVGTANHLGDEFLQLLQQVVARLGLKFVAGQLDLKPSDLHHMLHRTKRMYLRAEHVPWLIKHAPDGEALEFLAALQGRETVPAQPLDPAEELAALKESLERELGPEMRAVVLRGARRGR